MDEAYPQLSDFSELPESEPRTFRVNEQPVTFTPDVRDGRLRGWEVTIGLPDYHGYLTAAEETTGSAGLPVAAAQEAPGIQNAAGEETAGAASQQPVRRYEFRAQGAMPDMAVGPIPMTFQEFADHFVDEHG